MNAELAAELAGLTGVDAIETAKRVNRLLGTTSGALMLLRSIDQGAVKDSVVSIAVEQAIQHTDVSIRDLFERFVAPDQRVKRLGNVIQPAQILSLVGDVFRGKQVFSATAGVSCRNCHRVGKEGKEVGPDLTEIGKKYTRAQMLESILEPSKRIDPKYVTYLVETTDGRVLSGLLVSKDENEVIIRDAMNMLVRIPIANVEQLVTREQSLMPDLLLRDMTAEQVADLLAYLGSLK